MVRTVLQEAPTELAQAPEIVQVPALQLALGVPTYPELHVRSQVVPLGASAAHVPCPPLAMTGRPEHGPPLHTPEVAHELDTQLALRAPVKPVLQVGVQVVPLALFATQFPVPALKIVGRPAQERGVQDPNVAQAPALQVADSVPVKPVRQTGTQVAPLAELMTQVPASALEIVGNEAQVELVQVPVLVHAPSEQVALNVPVNPTLQVGVQVVPLAAFATQFPAPALVTVGGVVQAVLVQLPVGIQVPDEHVACIVKNMLRELEYLIKFR